ncbi:LysR family transcriptional regulator [Streptomyces griseicoloratus]|uniref:LysR family transcriptional regulator n=1 Tax=Streptomyces griseicoloratus TaxID=2752516 RepID=UPI002810C57F|nr:LysR family transcriptional regulator [Streptomyces griseicoloratus]
MLDVRKLVLLREVQARGSIAAAAEALNYTRSAVSQQLSTLEAETGAELLDRGKGRASLTAAGRMLVEHVERILIGLEAAESELAALSGRVSGELRVGVPFHEGPAMLVPALTRVRRAHPDLKIVLRGLPVGGTREAVRLGEVDLALAVRYDHVPEPSVAGLHEEPLVGDRVRLVVGPEEAAPGARPGPGDRRPLPRTLAGYAGQPWVLTTDSGLGALALHACAQAGFAPDVVARTSDPHAVLGLVSFGWGVSLMPDLVPDRPGYPVRRVALDGPELVRHLSLVVRSGHLDRPAVDAVITEVRHAVDELPEDAVVWRRASGRGTSGRGERERRGPSV